MNFSALRVVPIIHIISTTCFSATITVCLWCVTNSVHYECNYSRCSYPSSYSSQTPRCWRTRKYPVYSGTSQPVSHRVSSRKCEESRLTTIFICEFPEHDGMLNVFPPAIGLPPATGAPSKVAMAETNTMARSLIVLVDRRNVIGREG